MAGNKETVTKAIEKPGRFRTELVKQGILLFPVIWGSYKKDPIQKRGFRTTSKVDASLPSIGVSLIINCTFS